MERSLSVLFVLAACGKLAALEGADEANGAHTLGSLHDKTQRSDGAIKDRPAFVERKGALIEESFEKGGRDSSAG
jgi:hypothetical protein